MDCSALCPRGSVPPPPRWGNWGLVEKQVGAVLLYLGPCSGRSTVAVVPLNQTPSEEAKSDFLFLESICSRVSYRGSVS